MGYCNLRELGCDKKNALTFCNIKRCKIDSSLKKDGPSSHRILKTNFKIKMGKISTNGWQNSNNFSWDVG